VGRAVRITALSWLTVLVVVGGWWDPSGAQGQAPPSGSSATLAVTPTDGAVGADVVVELRDWPDGPVFVGSCGNEARRGSEDCNQPATRSVLVREGRATTRLRLAAPPIHCPCVVRAATTDGELVRLAPILLVGVPVGPPVLPLAGRADAEDLEVRARTRAGDRGVVDRILPLVAGPVRTELVVRVRNVGAEPVRDLVVTAAVGRTRREAAPLGRRTVPEIAPGASTTVTVPVRIDGPTWGRYEVSGAVYGLDAPVYFTVPTRVDPWLVEAMLPIVLLAVAWAARRRERRTGADEPPCVPLADSSPRVGDQDEGRSRAAAYGPPIASAP
jgi:hypothetical protein